MQHLQFMEGEESSAALVARELPVPPALSRLATGPTAARLRRNLTRNLTALQQHRPAAYAAVIASLNIAEIAVCRGRGGWLTLQRQGALAGAAARQDDPVDAAAQVIADVQNSIAAGAPLALLGLGDGYILSWLADDAPELLLGREQAVFIFEPDPAQALGAMALHDFSGESGPIAQQRFQWFIGERWQSEFLAAAEADAFAPFPECTISLSARAGEIDAELRRILQQLNQSDQQAGAQIESYYAGISPEFLASLFSESPTRPPRVLLVTSRFTTVLQYSTAAADRAFQSLGCHTRTLIEPSAAHTLRKPAMRRALLEFKPDLVLFIDHLRGEFGDVFPRNLPFVCWIQDHLPNLTHRAAGESVGLRDFILTAIGTHFIAEHGYPARQIIDVPNLGHAAKIPSSWSSQGLDLAYTSNWSTAAEEIVNLTLASFSSSAELHSFTRMISDRLAALYALGESIATLGQMRRFVQSQQKSAAFNGVDADALNQIALVFWDRLNNHLYRHQALLWLADLADAQGLSLGLFGRGWETHPRLAKYARGFVKPGADLESLLRDTKINFQLEPFACFTHPRLLNGLFAGGFFLVRAHPNHELPLALLNFLHQHLDDRAQDLASALELIDPAYRADLQALIDACAEHEPADPVQWARNWERSRLLVPGEPALPKLQQVSFSDAGSLAQRIGHFLGHPEERQDIAVSQRQALLGRLSYSAGFQRVCRRIGESLRNETKSTRGFGRFASCD